MRCVCVAAALALSCAEVPPPRPSPDELAARFRERTCSAVVAAYANGARPSMLEIEMPGPQAEDPPSRVLLMAPHIVSAESCLGQPDPFVAVTPSATPNAASTASTTEPRPLSNTPSARKPQPLDTRN